MSCLRARQRRPLPRCHANTSPCACIAQSFSLNSGCRLKRLLVLCHGDSALMTSWLGLTASCTSALGIFLSPLVGGLSDAVGRKYVVAVGRMGAALYMITSLLARTMRQQFVLVVVATGLVMQGNLAVQQAMFDDLFAERPQLGALIMANNDIPRNLAGTVGPMIGALCVNYCEPLGHWLPFAMISASALLWATGTETLLPEKRKPFRFGRSNPLSGVLVLLCNGRGLRQLALAAGIYHSCITPTVGFRQGVRTLATPGALNWSPAQSNVLDSANFLWNSVSNKFVQPPLLRRYNNKGAFELWSIVAIVCAVAVSVSCRPFGASPLRRSIQYAIPALIVTHPWGEVCMNSIRAMTIKQGVSVTDVGRGELSSAYSVLTTLFGAATPILWSKCFAHFAKADSGSKLGFLGPYGHMAVVAIVRLAALLCVKCIPAHELHLEDENQDNSDSAAK